jgi:hypothetical protein
MGMVGIWKLLMRGRRVADDGQETFSADGVPGAPAIYLFENDTQTGPFSPQQIAEMQAMGSISQDTLYWQDGMADWRSLSELSSGE